MFKKLISLAIAAMMTVSVGAVAASAAEVEAPVAADESAVVSADSSSETGAENKIYFDVESSGWKNYQYIFCHIWAADGSGTWTSWGTRAERCVLEDDGRWSYDLSKTGNEIKSSDGNKYCVIFAADTGIQTYNTIMSGSCIGDEVYITGNVLENPEDDAKTCIEAAWRNNPVCGPEKKIASSGNIVGTAFPEGESNETLLATYLMAYDDDEAKMAKVQDLINELNVSPANVLAIATQRVNDKVKEGAITQEDADTEIANIKKTLLACTDPTAGGEKVNEEDLNKAEESGKEASDSGEKLSGGNAAEGSASTNTSNGSSESASTGSGSSSVSSGQETTIFFVLGGVLLTAAGVMFLARRRED